MPKDNDQEYEIIAKGDLVMLRPIVVTDRAHWDCWQTQGEWVDKMHYGMLREEWENMG